jgi:hypothetical protein
VIHVVDQVSFVQGMDELIFPKKHSSGIFLQKLYLEPYCVQDFFNLLQTGKGMQQGRAALKIN